MAGAAGPSLGRALGTLLLLAALCYGGALLLARTDGFRYLLEQRLQHRWAEPQLQLGRVWLDLLLDLRLENIRITTDDGSPPLTIDEVRVRWWPTIAGWRGPFYRWTAVEVIGWEANYPYDAAQPQPPVWLAMASRHIAARSSVWPDETSNGSLLPTRRFTARARRLRWLDAQGHVVIELTDVHYLTATTRLLGRTIRLEDLHAGRARQGDFLRQDIRQEWIYLDP